MSASLPMPSPPNLARRTTWGAGTGELSRQDVVRASLRRSVRLQVREGDQIRRTASGVVVATETTAQGTASYVLTNAHAIDSRGLDAPRLWVLVGEGSQPLEHVGEAVASGSVPELDLALVRVLGVRLEPVELAGDDELELGADVLVVAAPYGKALSLSGGLVSHVEWDARTRLPKMLKTDAPIGYGASGGGVYALVTGKLLAIIEGYRTAKVGFEVGEHDYSFDVPMPGETFAAPVAKVRQFLQAKGYGRLLTRAVRGEEARSASR